MKAAIRPLDDPSLEAGVAELRVHAYSQFAEAHDSEYYADTYAWFKRHPLGDDMRRWVAATEDGRVVGHLAAMPQHYRVLGKRVVAHTPADYMVHDRHGFQAISLMRRFFGSTENCVSCDMVPAVINVETRLGAELAGELRYAAKLLNVARLPVPPLPGPLRRLLGPADRPDEVAGDAEGHDAPLPVRARMPIPAPLKALLNGGLRTVDENLANVFAGGLEVREMGAFDESFDDLFEKVAAVVPCTPEKDAAFLRWRYGPGSPQYPVTILGVKGGETLLGYAVLMIAAHGEDGFVLDLTTIPGRRDVARALLAGAARFFRGWGVQIIRYRFVESSTSPTSGDLRKLGYFYREGRGNKLLVRFEDPALQEAARDVANWSYTVGDGEAAFWTR